MLKYQVLYLRTCIYIYFGRKAALKHILYVQENQIIFVIVEIGCTDSTLRLPRENIPGATQGLHSKMNIIYNSNIVLLFRKNVTFSCHFILFCSVIGHFV
jgi:hypothetical protein